MERTQKLPLPKPEAGSGKIGKKNHSGWGLQKTLCCAAGGVFMAAGIVMRLFFSETTLIERSVLLMLAFLMLLVSEALPVSLTSFLAVGMMPLLGLVGHFSESFLGFANPVVCFILASFGLAAALTKVPLSRRLLKGILQLAGNESRKITGAFMLSTAVFSSVVSNVPTCAVFLSIAQVFLSIYEGDEKRQTGKTLMIGIPVASMIGGVMTPAGSSINILALSLLEKHAGISISFVQWMAVGVPVCFILLPVAWFILIKVHPPAFTEKKQLEIFLNKLDIPSEFRKDEKKVAIILSAAVAFMLISSWVPGIPVPLVALLACSALCLPGIGVLDATVFLKNVDWDSVILVGTVLSLSAMLAANGAVTLVADAMLNVKNFPPVLFMLCVALAVFVLLIFIPVAPSLVAIIAPIIVHTASALGIPPEWPVLICAICAGNCYLIPLDTVCLLTYSLNYYKMTDMARVTAPLQIVAALASSCMAYGIGMLLLS